MSFVEAHYVSKSILLGGTSGKWLSCSRLVSISIILHGHHKPTLPDAALDLVDENGAAIIPRIKIKLALISEGPEVFMTSIDADVARLDGNSALAGASGDIDTAISVAEASSAAVQTLGNCVRPLGQALQLIVKIMDSIADVRQPSSEICCYADSATLMSRHILY